MSNAALMKHWRYKQAAVGITCALCGEPISVGGDKDKGALTADHILPKSLGGTWAKQNLQPAHLICNRKRQNMLMHEFKGAVDAEARVRRAIEIIEAHEQATKPRLTLP